MENEHTISGLVRKRAEIAGRIEQFQREIHGLATDLNNIDAAIRIFDPTYNTNIIQSKMPRGVYYAYRGEITRVLLDTLRDAKTPMSTPDLAFKVMAARGMDATDKALKKRMVVRTGKALRTQRAKGVVRSKPGQGQAALWTMIET